MKQIYKNYHSAVNVSWKLNKNLTKYFETNTHTWQKSTWNPHIELFGTNV